MLAGQCLPVTHRFLSHHGGIVHRECIRVNSGSSFSANVDIGKHFTGLVQQIFFSFLMTFLKWKNSLSGQVERVAVYSGNILRHIIGDRRNHLGLQSISFSPECARLCVIFLLDNRDRWFGFCCSSARRPLLSRGQGWCTPSIAPKRCVHDNCCHGMSLRFVRFTETAQMVFFFGNHLLSKFPFGSSRNVIPHTVSHKVIHVRIILTLTFLS